MYRQDTYSSNNSSSASGSEYNSDITAEYARSEPLNINNSAKSGNAVLANMRTSDMASPTMAVPFSDPPPPPEINDPVFFRPSCGHVEDIVWQYNTIRGWLTKHIPPSYSFTKSRKVRYFVLADRMLYAFKNDQRTSQYREFFEITKDTDVFVTDYFQGVTYCIEITKRGIETKSWFLECSDAEHMKTWLDRLKRTVGWLKENESKGGIITNNKLDQMYVNEHEAIVANALAPVPAPAQESCYSSNTGLVTPKAPPLLADPSYYQSIMMKASVNHYQQQKQQQQHQHYYQSSPQHQHFIPSPLASPVHTLSEPIGNIHYTNAYVDEWEPTQKEKHYQLQRQYTHSPRAVLSTSHALPPQRPPPRRALPPPPSPATILPYHQYHQHTARSAYMQ
ncbi:hypothetical protein BX666DRAFT_1974128 [Dichotomocladium elegans]|nr:hypothetical protein BX666DRAFT_1974128 [Dichotomocladium elegans]